MEKIEEENILKKSEAVYQPKRKRITFGTSLHAMNEEDAKAMAEISPVNHLQNATEMMKNVYAEQLKEPMNKELNFK